MGKRLDKLENLQFSNKKKNVHIDRGVLLLVQLMQIFFIQKRKRVDYSECTCHSSPVLLTLTS